jgi:hypothetical protein
MDDQRSERRSRAAVPESIACFRVCTSRTKSGWKIRLETRLQHGLVRAGFKIERDGWHPAIVIRVGKRLQSEKRIGKQVP